jgi:HEAT repeat protein
MNLRATLEALSSNDVGDRRDACYASVDVGGPEVVAALIDTLERHPNLEYNGPRDIYQSSRKGAAYALGKLGDPSSTPVLLVALSKDDEVAASGARYPFFFGASVKEGLEEADTEFARDILQRATTDQQPL